MARHSAASHLLDVSCSNKQGPSGSWWVAESSSLTATESAAIGHRLLLAVRIVPVRDTHTPTMTSVKAGLCYISKNDFNDTVQILCILNQIKAADDNKVTSLAGDCGGRGTRAPVFSHARHTPRGLKGQSAPTLG